MNAGTVLNGNEQKKKNTASINTYIDNYYKDDKASADKVKKLVSYDALGNAKIGDVSIGAPTTGSDGNPQYSVDLLSKAIGGYDAATKPVAPATKAQYTPNSSLNDRVASESGKLISHLYGTNPFETEAAKSIRKTYDIQGEFAKGGALAEGSARNSGNLDSYAAANALKQRAAYASLGDQAILNQHNATIASIKDVIGMLGEQSDREFNQKQTALNSENARKLNIANVTGYVPKEWQSGESTKTAAMQELDSKNALEREKIGANKDIAYAELGEQRYATDTNANLAKESNALERERIAVENANREADRLLEQYKSQLSAEQQAYLAQFDRDTQLMLMDKQTAGNLALEEKRGANNIAAAYAGAAKEAAKKSTLTDSQAKYIAEHESEFSGNDIAEAMATLGGNMYMSYKNAATGENVTVTPEITRDVATEYANSIGKSLNDFFTKSKDGSYKLKDNLTKEERTALIYGGNIPSDKYFDDSGNEIDINNIPWKKDEPIRIRRVEEIQGILPMMEEAYPDMDEETAAAILKAMGLTEEEVAAYATYAKTRKK